MANKHKLNQEPEIIDAIRVLAEHFAFQPIGSRREEMLKTIIISAYSLIKADKTADLFNVLMQKLKVLNQNN
ncbi:hypothetical protein ACFOWA_13210 [Pedobacter lithocola]|uniref:Uncharacterized protein n=1 Tax=Pedobacter lithocola TaxID=1908239 RepID=A0ABV8PDC1_9SPHI